MPSYGHLMFFGLLFRSFLRFCAFLVKIFAEKFGSFKKVRTFAIPFGKYAEIAQLVEHNLAKVGVASSSLVFRSKKEVSRNADLLFETKSTDLTTLSFGSRTFTRRGTIICQSSLCTRDGFFVCKSPEMTPCSTWCIFSVFWTILATGWTWMPPFLVLP